MEDESIDVVYTSHSLEPNVGREEAALEELLRITKHYLILIEPIYELGSIDAQKRMRSHGYVRDLMTIVEKLGGQVQEYRLLPYSSNPLNPSGVIVVRKNTAEGKNPTTGQPTLWRCPLTATPLQNFGDSYFSATTGIAYPVLRGIPLLRPEHAVVASKLTLNDKAIFNFSRLVKAHQRFWPPSSGDRRLRPILTLPRGYYSKSERPRVKLKNV